MSGRARRQINQQVLPPEEETTGERISEIAVSECYRVRLIGDLSKLICEGDMPESMRSAGLELIGYLARRFPGEQAHDLGVEEARRAVDERCSLRRRR